MVLLGLTPTQAIATAKFGGLGMNIGANSRFFREKITDKRTVIIFSIIGGVGAIGGSFTLVHFQDHTELLQRLMGIAILVAGIPLLYVRKLGLKSVERARWLKIVGLILLGFGVILQTALGSGIGSLQQIVLMTCFGMTALVASATRRAMQLTVAAISLAIYVATGLVDYQFGVVNFATSLIGGYAGAHIAIKKGNKFVVNMFAIISALLAFQLLFG
jgi:uncharacterized membrane protein YfcA